MDKSYVLRLDTSLNSSKTGCSRISACIAIASAIIVPFQSVQVGQIVTITSSSSQRKVHYFVRKFYYAFRGPNALRGYFKVPVCLSF